MKKILKSFLKSYIDTNKWDDVEIQCRPFGIFLLFASVIGVQAFLSAWEDGYKNPWMSIYPILFVSIAASFDIAAWLNAKRYKGKLVPLFIYFDSLFYSSCVFSTSIFLDAEISYAFFCLYLVMLLYWATISGFSIVGASSVFAGPSLLCLIFNIDKSIFVLFLFGFVMYYFVSSNTKRRMLDDNKHEKSKAAIKVVDDILNRYHCDLISSQTLFMHDVKNKLAAARMNCYFVLDDIDNGRNINQLDLKESMDDMLACINGTVDSLKKFIIKRQECSGEFYLPSIVKDVEQTGILINGDVPKISIVGRCDKLIAVLKNLYNNSIESGADSVVLKCGFNGFCVVMEVRDNGSGIGGENLPMIFRPYSSQKKDGTGLGLFLSRQVMRSMSGDLFLISTSENGTKFGIKLTVSENRKSMIA